MSLDLEPRVVVEDASYVTTPKVRTTIRRLAFWLGVLVVILIGGLLTVLIAGTGTDGPDLDGTNASANGSKALVQVLRANGVTVDTPRSLDRALADVGSVTDETTIVVYDENAILTTSQLTQLDGVAQNLILIEPSFRALTALAPGVHLAGFGNNSFTADCAFLPVKRAGTVSGSASSYRVDPSTDAQQCLSSGNRANSLVRLSSGSTSVTVFGISDALTNQNIVNDGNAALALGLFGQNKHLVWYLPSPADVAVPAADAPVPLPGWVLPTETLFALVVLAAAFWRGRRFGPLVIERLPVVVRASETMEGRARLYQKASSRTHALDALRIGTLGRLAGLCGLPRLASVDEIVGAVATTTGRTVHEIRALLVDDIPSSDRQLLELSDQLQLLELEVAETTRPI